MKINVICTVLATVVVASLTVFNGCSKGGDETESLKGRITVITQRTDLVDTEFQTYRKLFEAKFPGAKVEFEAIKDYESDIVIRMQTKEYGDVLMLPDAVPSEDFPAYFEPLGTVEEFSEKYRPEFLTTKISNGQVYGLAAMANAQGIIYNKRIFKEAGIDSAPKSPDEFIAALELIKQKTDAIPYYTNYHAGWTLTQWQDHAWGSLTGDPDYHNNKIVKDRTPFDAGKSNYILYKLLWDICNKGLIEQDPVTSDWEMSKIYLNEGKIASMLLGSWSISQIENAGDHPEDVGYMAFPYTIDGVQYASAGSDYCYAINVNSTHKALAKEWIKFMIDESGFALSQGSISLLKSDPMPSNLTEFADVKLVVDNPATEENQGLFDRISNESEVGLYSLQKEKQRIVDSALGKTNESFDDIMADWNKKWARTVDSYNAAGSSEK